MVLMLAIARGRRQALFSPHASKQQHGVLVFHDFPAHDSVKMHLKGVKFLRQLIQPGIGNGAHFRIFQRNCLALPR